MSEADNFFDTNVLLYLLSKDTAKADRAEVLLASGGVVSVQVLNEFASVASRKLATACVPRLCGQNLCPDSYALRLTHLNACAQCLLDKMAIRWLYLIS
jgi:predicted nucleic acid-binding protein